MQPWKTVAAFGLVVAIGFSAGHQWHALAGQEPDESVAVVVATAGTQTQNTTTPATGLVAGDSYASKETREVAASFRANELVLNLSQNTNRESSDSISDTPVESKQIDPFEVEQAFAEVSLIVSEQINSGQWYPGQQAAINAASENLTLAQRTEIMEQFVGAMNRGEIAPSMPLPPI